MKRLFTFLTILTALLAFSVPVFATDISDDAGVNGEESNVFEAFYDTVCEHTSEILCALSVLATGALAIAYKKGLIPLISKSLSAIVGGVGKMKDATEREADMLKAEAEKLGNMIDGASAALDGVLLRLSNLETALNGISKIEKSEDAIKIILSQQVDTLADIFMNSAMPEYRKSELAERLKVMKEELENVNASHKVEET